MDVTVVIVSYNVADLLDKCIESIKIETSCQYEIIVVDNNSEDNSVEMLTTKHSDVIFIQNRTNLGFSKANNQAFRISKGRYIFMLNPDTVILNGAIDKLVDFMDTQHKAGACGPKNTDQKGRLQHNCHHFPDLLMRVVECLQLKRLFPQHRYFGREHMTYWSYDEIKEVDWITGCSLLIRREALQQVGLLDEKYFMYSEETDLCYRLRKRGWQILFYPLAYIIHYGGESALSQFKEKVFSKSITNYLFATRYYFFKKNYGYLRWFGLKTLDTLYYLIIIIKNLFRKDVSLRRTRIEEAKTVLSTIFFK